MKISKRIVPFTTIILTDSSKYDDFSQQVFSWVKSDSFNPQASVYIVDCIKKNIKFVSLEKGEILVHEESYSFLSLLRFIQKLKPSYAIDFCNNAASRSLLLFSRSGRNVSQRGLFSLFFCGVSYKAADKNSLKTAAPYFFNNPGNERFGYRTTKLLSSDLNYENFSSDGEEIVLDFGALPLNPEGKILWIPKRKTAKGMWADFIKTTYFAEKLNCTIDVHFQNEKALKRFSSVFFIKGHKKNLDKYLNLIIAPDLLDLIFEKDSCKYKMVIFSFTMAKEYFQIRSIFKEKGLLEKLTTTSKIDNDSI